ncbi:MAG TPA: hypothetical protein VFH45_05690 [Acidimicrobiales bacterium]|nr:hypothetical protein [Acidimicrobiales bacterium]
MDELPTTRSRRSPRRALLSALFAGLVVAAPVGQVVPGGGAAAAAPATPAAPDDPAQNIPPTPAIPASCASAPTGADCEQALIVALDHARAAIGLPPYELPAGFASLPPEEQLFVLSNLDRVDLGLAPAAALDPGLNQAAAAGLAGGHDPKPPSTVNGGTVDGWATNFAAGQPSALAAFYSWMYADGFGAGNVDCRSLSDLLCWVHRQGTLLDTSGHPAAALLMGAAAATGRAYAELFVIADGAAPAPAEMTWPQAQAAGYGSQPAPVVSQVSPAAGAPGTGVVVSGFNLGGGTVSFGSAPAGGASCDATRCQVTAPPGAGRVDVSVTTPFGRSSTWSGDRYDYPAPGYWIADGAGQTAALGGAQPFAPAQSSNLIAGIAPTPDGGGYWLVASDGGIFSFGDAVFHGSTGALRLAKPIVGMAATPDGGGYWLVASDGGVFSFGDAHFFGSTGAMRLARPIVGMASTPDGRGYWLVASDGGIFSFGDAAFHGSTGALHLAQPIVGMAPTPDGAGYWLVASDGGIFTFGDAVFHGSTGAIRLAERIVGMAPTPNGAGYWLVAADGGLFTFGDATFFGSAAGHLHTGFVVGMAVS